MANEYVMTHEGVQEIEAKLEYLKTVKRREIAEQIKAARAFGDISENAEYDEAKNEQARVEMEIANLEHTLKNAIVIDEKSVDVAVVNVGTTVKVLDKAYGKEEVFYIVGAAEADVVKRKIANDSPVGSALIGKKTGNKVKIDAPGGEIEMQILDITK